MRKIIKNKPLFAAGIVILLLFLASYFITIKTESGQNYIVNDRLLGILIFHNPFVFAIYALAIIIILVRSLK